MKKVVFISDVIFDDACNLDWFDKFDIRFLNLEVLTTVGAANLRGDAFISVFETEIDAWTESNKDGIGVWSIPAALYAQIAWNPRNPTRVLVSRFKDYDESNLYQTPYDKALTLLQRSWL